MKEMRKGRRWQQKCSVVRIWWGGGGVGGGGRIVCLVFLFLTRGYKRANLTQNSRQAGIQKAKPEWNRKFRQLGMYALIEIFCNFLEIQ